MRKLTLLAILFSAALAMAQTQSAPAPGTASQAPPAAAQPPMPSSEMRERMMEMREQRMMQMQDQQTREMQVALEAMRRKVSLLGSELLSIQDVNTRRAVQTDMELWQQLMDVMGRHMQGMQMQDRMMPNPRPMALPNTTPPPKSPQTPQQPQQ